MEPPGGYTLSAQGYMIRKNLCVCGNHGADGGIAALHFQKLKDGRIFRPCAGRYYGGQAYGGTDSRGMGNCRRYGNDAGTEMRGMETAWGMAFAPGR